MEMRGGERESMARRASCQIELITMTSATHGADSRCPRLVSGNRKRFDDHHSIPIEETLLKALSLGFWGGAYESHSSKRTHSQFQKREIRVAVVRPVFALLRYVVLEHGRGFGVIAVEPVEDGFDVLGPFRHMIKCYTHCGALFG